MTRSVFQGRSTDSAAHALAANYPEVISAVAQAVGHDAVVVVGMAQNPFVKKARVALTEAGVAFSYLEYGSYFSQWKERLAIKMWSGWPTFPQVFVHGTLVGGFTDLQAAIADDSLKVLLEANQD
jgi:monothiol glutaredoxin